MRIEHGLLPGHVLQRRPGGARAVIGGTCGAVAGTVTATVRRGTRALPGLKAKRIGVARAGRFTATLAGLPAGGPYSVELACGDQRVRVDEVFVGDLWLMAGQSNMEGYGNLEGLPEPHPLVRCFTMARRWELARDPLHLLQESPDPAHGGAPLDARAAARAKRQALKGGGVGLPFAKLMQARSGVPQGLIATAHGGTSMAQWNPAGKERGGETMYGSMWLSLQAVGQPIAGVLWYQGCGETSPADAPPYTARMQALVAALRADLGQPRLPWVIVQIGRVVDHQREFLAWNAVQEQQRLLPTVIPRCDVVPAVDLDLDDGIHIATRAFPLLAERMAQVAARLVLGDRRLKPAIQPRSARFLEAAGGRGMGVEVRFANVVGGLRSAGRALGFSLLDAEGHEFQPPYAVELDGDRARILFAGRSVAALSVMYGRGTDPVCTLGDARGMAVPVFGPLAVAGIPAFSPFFLRWRVAPLGAGEDLAALARPAAGAAVERRFGPDFVNLHPEWEGRSGHVSFHGQVDAAEAMEVEVRCGYDGPFRLWFGDREVHTDLHGTNPATADRQRIALRLPAGRTPVTVLMALNQGRAWGFFLRLARPAGQAVATPWA
jgi:hypothetical protein